MGALRGLYRRTHNHLRANRLVLDSNKDTTPSWEPLYILPTAAPTNGAEGSFYFDSTQHAPFFRDDAGYVQVAALSNAQTFDAAQTFSSDVTFGDAVTDTVILKGRMSTGTVAGSALAIGSTYTNGEGMEFRWTVSDWTGVNGDFRGMYVRPQSDTDSEHTLYGIEIQAVANGADVASLQGLYANAYTKGDTAETVAGGVWGVHGEVGWDASRANSTTLTTGAAPLMGRVLSGKVADYTKIHGTWLQFGDMDGGSRTFGDAFHVIDSADESGTSALTNMIYTDMACTSFIKVSADGKGGFTVGAIPNANPESDAEDGWIAVNIGATQYAIPIYATAA